MAEAAGSYDTLSYCWASPDRTQPVVCDNAPFSVTPNLESALKRLRAPDVTRNFWIDQLCIDEDNLPEKEMQLGLMADIYRSSRRLFIWLGDDGDELRKASKIIDRLSRLDPSRTLVVTAIIHPSGQEVA